MTAALASTQGDVSNFYSHAREGRDGKTLVLRAREAISTHTPARGVTRAECREDYAAFISTHTPARGVTKAATTHLANMNFYSHAREGRDNALGYVVNSFTDFYSHAREGRDFCGTLCVCTKIISTHTPARGVTPIFCILGRSRHHITQGGLIFLMILNHTSIKNYIFPGEPSGDFGVIEGSLFCEWISI